MKTLLIIITWLMAISPAVNQLNAQIAIQSDEVYTENSAAFFGVVDIASFFPPVLFDEVELPPNSTWDFTWVEPAFLQSRKVVQPLASPFGEILPGNRVLLYNNGGSGADYFLADQDEIRKNGNVSAEYISLNFEGGEVMMKFPFTFGQTHQGDYSFNLTWFWGEEIIPGLLIDSVRRTENINYSYEVISWGTLELPSGAYDVLLQKRELVRDIIIDHYPAGAAQWSPAVEENQEMEVQYVFYAEGTSFPVMRMIDFGGSGFIFDYEWIHGQPALSVNDPLEASVSIYPNPASDFISVETGLSGETHYTMMDATGRLVRSQKGDMNQIRFDLNGLPAGLYFLITENKGNRQSTKFIIQ